MSARKQLSRRSFVGLIGASAASALLPACSHDEPPQEAVSPSASSLPSQYGFLMTPAKCIKCGLCVVACENANNRQQDSGYRRLVSYGLPSGAEAVISLACMHCRKPACVEICPSKALAKREDGIVSVDRSRCIGCRSCGQACPFDIPRYDRGGVDKCDCCLRAGVKAGDKPFCVSACHSSALQYGKVDSLLEGQAEKVIAIDARTEPSYYLAQA